VLDRVLTALGIDATQWRALARTYITLDFRSAGGAMRQDRSGRSGASPLIGLLFITGISSVAFASVAAVFPDPLMSASLMTTYGAATTMMLLLVDFAGVVISPDDYGILGPRPVGSRTYFAARLASVAVYVGAISLVMALLPAIVYTVKLGPLAGVAALLAVLLCNLATAVLIITGYVGLLHWIHPARLRRAMSYLQLVAAMLFYGVYYLATRAFQSAFLARIGFEGARWLWVMPSTWFASFVAVAGGQAPAAAWLASAAAVVLCAACVPLAAGRLSLDYARRVGEMSAVGEPASRRRRTRPLPGFASGEARAVALLVRGQFRFDQRFRMGVLGILPLTGFYLLLGMNQGALEDPFLATSQHGGPGVFFAIVFIPMTLHAALTVSESWRAAWIFFASPASHARIVVAAKNFISIYFLGAYLLVLAAFWSYFFTRVWHAVIHALFAGLLAHLLLQMMVMVKPTLPFAAEPRKAERSAGLFGVFFAGSIVAGFFPLVLSFVYRSLPRTFGVLGFALIVTAAIEYALRLRVDEAIGELEFRS
jgi:ABC-2 type transport system permease protein